MTVNTTSITSGPYTGNGVTTSFPYTFKAFTDDNVIVYQTVGTVQSTLTLGTHYSVTGTGVDGGGNVVMVTAPALSDEIYIRSNYSAEQLTDFDSQGGFYPDTHEDAFDKQTMLIQQLEDIQGRGLRLPLGDSSGVMPELSPDPLKLLRWNAAGDAVENVDITIIDPDAVATDILVYTVETFAALATTPATTAGMVVYTKQYASSGVGGLHFQDTSGTITNNGVTLINNTITAGRHWKAVNYTELSGYNFGMLCDGVTDDTVAAQRVLTAGLIAKLPDNKTSCISSRLTWSLPNSGFICSTEFHWKMLRAGFTQATYVTVINTVNCGFYASGIDSPTFINQHVYLESGSGIRTAIAAAFSNCTNLNIVNPRASGFQETEFGVFTVDSCIGGRCLNGKVTDCTTATNTLPTMQITGLEVDENRISSVYSSEINFGTWVFKNLTLTGAALTLYGHQADGVTLSGGATTNNGKGCIFDAIICDTVDEPLDIQSSNHYIGAVIAKNSLVGAKFVHGARNNRIDFVSVDQTNWHGVVFAGSNTATSNCRGNSVGRVVCRGVGSLGGGFSSPSAVAFDGGSAVIKPNDNAVHSVAAYDCASMSYLVYAEAGVRNIVEDAYTETAPISGYVSVVAPAQCQVNLRADTDIYVKLAVDTAFSSTNTLILPNVVRDALSEYNTTTGLFTAKSGGTYEISANVRTAAVAAAGHIGLRVNENGIEVAMAQQDNDSVGSKEKISHITKVVTLTAGQTAKVVFYSSASTTLTANTPYTNMSIRKIK